MLRTLRIRQFVILEDVTVEFAGGLNLLTGETGAGKSILVDALGLATGDRAERGMIRAGADAAVIEALFEIDESSAVHRWAGERGLDDVNGQSELLVRREVPATGSGRVHVNGSPVTLGLLRELGRCLLELHGQHEQQSLLAAEQHRLLLDRFGEHGPLLERVEAACAATRAALERRESLLRQAGERAARRAELQHVVREIEEIDPRPGELEQLDGERRMLRNAARVTALLDELVDLTYEGENGAAGLTAAAARKAGELASYDAGLAELAERLAASTVELQDVGAAFRDYRDGRDFDPARLDSLEQRRVLLERLLLRHGPDEAAALAELERARDELAGLAGLDESLREVEAQIAEAALSYREQAGRLSEARRRSAAVLGPAVESQLSALALDKARFEVALAALTGAEPVPGRGEALALGPAGAERVEFLLAANPGEPARPLGKAASGGELSRVMLALHAVLEGAAPGRALVFDEVDAGVGGAVADAVGSRLAALAAHRQVLCVTHLPQVAAYADRHYIVRKHVEGPRTRAEVRLLGADERADELARMLGGKRPTATSRRHALELLEAAGRQTARTGRSQ